MNMAQTARLRRGDRLYYLRMFPLETLGQLSLVYFVESVTLIDPLRTASSSKVYVSVSTKPLDTGITVETYDVFKTEISRLAICTPRLERAIAMATYWREAALKEISIGMSGSESRRDVPATPLVLKHSPRYDLFLKKARIPEVDRREHERKEENGDSRDREPDIPF